MLNECLKQATQHNTGTVYIKDAIAPNSGKSLSVISNVTKLQSNSTAPFSGINNDTLGATIQTMSGQPLVGRSISSQTDKDHRALAEFLKMKPNIKVTPLGKNNSVKIEGAQEQSQLQQQPVTLQQTQQLQLQPTHIQQFLEQQDQPLHIQQQQPNFSQQTAGTACIQLQQLQQQLQQFQLQQQLQQQIQQITSQLQSQQTITFGPAPATPTTDMSPSKNKKPKLNFVLTSPTTQALSATLPQLAMNGHGVVQQQQPQIQLQLQSVQARPQATLFSNLATQPELTPNAVNSVQQQTSATTSSKCYLPITIKDDSSNQEFVAHIDAKNFMLPTTYQLQMKLQPQITSVDGQPVMQLTPASIPATLQLAASSSLNGQALQTLTSSNMLQLQALPMQQPQQLLQQQRPQHLVQAQPTEFQQKQHQSQDTMNAAAQVTTAQQQILCTGVELSTNDAATSTANDSLEDVSISNNQSNNQSIKQDTQTVIKPQRYRLSQHSISGSIEITPNINYTGQIMQPMQQLKLPQHQQKQPQKQLIQKQSKQNFQSKQIQENVSVQRSPNKSTEKHLQFGQASIQQQQQEQQQLQQQHAKVPVLQKKDVTISRISKTPQTPQQQQQQQQSLLKLLPTTKLEEMKPMEAVALSQIQHQQQQRQEVIAQQLEALVSSSSKPKIGRKPVRALSTTTPPQLVQSANLLDNASANTITTNIKSAITTVPSQSSIEVQTAKVKCDGLLATAHGVGPNCLECSQCGRVFKKKEHLTQHVKLHAGLRPFKCKEEQCGKAFSRKEHLMRHEISHTGRKLFSCDICHKPFSRKDNLNKHRRIHTLPSENMYNCKICNKEFETKLDYEHHIQMHENSDAVGADDINNEKTTVSANFENIKELKNLQQQQVQLSQQTQQQSQLQQTAEQTQQQKRQYIEPIINAIPPSLMSTNQPHMQQFQLVQHQAGNMQYQPQQQPHQQLMQLQLPTVVSTQDLVDNTITTTQSNNPNMKATLGSHDAAVLNLPTTLANLMQLSHAQFVNPATGQILGHIKIEK